MLRREVQKRLFDLKPLLLPGLCAYLSTISETTEFTLNTLTENREMRLPNDLGIPLTKPPLNICTMAEEVAVNLKWLYQIAREIISFGYCRGKSR